MDAFATTNLDAIEAWNTVLFDKFVRFRHIAAAGLGTHGDAVLAKHPPVPGTRVLDLGCGFGDTTVQIARAVGAAGAAVGIDAAARFIEAARKEAAEAGVTNVRFILGDVQTATLDEKFDQAFSRFGTQFFASPVAALRNVRKALRSGSQLSMVVWRRKDENQWLHRAEVVVDQFVKRPEVVDAVTCGPGPFSMASADVTSAVMIGAGYHDVMFERNDADICIGKTIGEAVEFAMTLGPAGETLRLAGAEGERRRPEVEAALADALAVYQKPEGIYAPSSTWIVSGRA